MTRLSQEERGFLSRLGTQRAFRDVRNVCARFMRTAGSDAERKAAEDMGRESEKCGYSLEFESVSVVSWVYKDASFRLLPPHQREIDCMPWGQTVEDGLIAHDHQQVGAVE